MSCCQWPNSEVMWRVVKIYLWQKSFNRKKQRTKNQPAVTVTTVVQWQWAVSFHWQAHVLFCPLSALVLLIMIPRLTTTTTRHARRCHTLCTRLESVNCKHGQESKTLKFPKKHPKKNTPPRISISRLQTPTNSETQKKHYKMLEAHPLKRMNKSGSAGYGYPSSCCKMKCNCNGNGQWL